MSETVTTKATNNYPSIQLPINDLENIFTYDGNNNLITINVTYQGIVYTQTFTWVGINMINESQWTPPS